MKPIKNFIKTQNGDTAVFQFDGNHNFTRTLITFKEICASSDKAVTVQYVINGITSDPIFLGSEKIDGRGSVEIKAETPVGATHVYVTVPDFEKMVKEISLFEAKNDNTGGYYPKYFDTDLKENYFLDSLSVFTSPEGYRYDLITIFQQVLSNRAQDIHFELIEAYENKDSDKFQIKTEEFLKIADLMDETTANSEYYMLGRWVEQAKALAKNADDFTKMLYELNAKSLITTWGSYKQCETGGLRDYSNRQWSGLIGDFYKMRWEMWFKERIFELKGVETKPEIEWFPIEWRWARENTLYPNKPSGSDLKALGKKILG